MAHIYEQVLTNGLHSGGLSSIMRFGGIGGMVAAGGAALSLAQKIPQGHVGFRTHNGMAKRETDSVFPWGKRAGELYRVKPAGLRLKVPFTHGYDTLNIMPFTTEPHITRRQTNDGRQFELTSTFTWGVLPERNAQHQPIDYGVDWQELAFRAKYRAADWDELEKAITGVLLSGLVEVIPSVSSPEAIRRQHVQDGLMALCGPELLEEYGVGLRRYNLLEPAFTAPEVQGSAFGRSIGALLARQEVSLPPPLQLDKDVIPFPGSADASGA